jgi:hypothetical protein
MLTAERFASRYGSYWSAVFPRLEHFVRLTNLGPKRLAPALEITFAPERQALVSETAFMLWVGSQGALAADIEKAFHAARRRLKELVPEQQTADDLSDSERLIARKMAQRLSEYVSSDLELSEIEIEPHLPGCGTVSSGVPDVVAVDTSRGRRLRTVLEVKAVDRTYRSADFRQLATYAVLLFAARHYIPDLFALVNPLRGTAVEIGVGAFFEDSAGEPPDELIQHLLAEWSDPRLSG